MGSMRRNTASRELLVTHLLLLLDWTHGYNGWTNLQGANYVPSYSKHDVFDIFLSRDWNATIVDRELSYAKTLAVTSLRVFVTFRGWSGDPSPNVFIENYKAFQRLAMSHHLSLLITLMTLSSGSCINSTKFVNLVVGAEVTGAVIAYEAENEPAPWAMDYVKNCTLPAVINASHNPDVDISVGFAHWGEVAAMADMITTLNWHSYTGANNGGGLKGEIDALQKIANSYTPPKPLVLTEWLARPAQPLACAYPVIRDNKVAAYNWALVMDDCTTGWQKPVAPGDPPFQGMLWQNGSAIDDLEEGECMRTQCKTLTYIHHCCNMEKEQDNLFNFSQHSDDWKTVNFGRPVYKQAGPREGSLRQTNIPGASFTVGPLPENTKRIALYLPTSSHGAKYSVKLNGLQVYTGTTMGRLEWVARVVLPITSARDGESAQLELIVDKATTTKFMFNVTGVTIFST